MCDFFLKGALHAPFKKNHTQITALCAWLNVGCFVEATRSVASTKQLWSMQLKIAVSNASTVF